MLIDEILKKSKNISKQELYSCIQWKNEINKWLEHSAKSNHLNMARLDNPMKNIRRSTLAEISSAYYLEKILEHKIVYWDKPTYSGRDIDFVFNANNQIIFSDVKCPTWEGELSDEERRNGRKNRSKYINGDARRIEPWQKIRGAIMKSYPKFLNDSQNLLIINDDLFVSFFNDKNDYNINKSLFDDTGINKDYYPEEVPALKEKGCFASGEFKNIGGVLFLDCSLINETFKYQHKFLANPYASKPFNI